MGSNLHGESHFIYVYWRQLLGYQIYYYAYWKLIYLICSGHDIYTYLYLSCNCMILSTNKEGQINFSVI